MNIKHLKLVISFCLVSPLALASNSQANTFPPASIEELRQLYEMDAYGDTYIVGQSMLFDHEGDPNFDFIYAMSAIETGNVDEGVYIFERLVENDPTNVRYRLELGRGYYLKRDNEKSKKIFEDILKTQEDLPPAVKKQVEAFLYAIKNKKNTRYAHKKNKFSGFAGLAAGQDDNPGSASVEDYYIAGTDLLLTNDEIETAYYSAQLAGKYTRLMGTKKSIDLMAYASQRINSEEDTEEFEITNYLISSDFKTIVGKNLLTAGLRFNAIQRGGEDLYDNPSFRLAFKQAINKGFIDILNTSLSLGAIRYDDPTTAASSDIDTARLSFSVIKRNNQYLNNLGLAFGRDDAVEDDSQFNSRNYYVVSYGLSYAFDNKNSLSGSISFQDSMYDEINPNVSNNDAGDLEKRDTRLTTYNLTYGHTFSKKLSFSVTGVATRSKSDLSIYIYDANRVEMGAIYQF